MNPQGAKEPIRNMQAADFGGNERAKQFDLSDINGTGFFDENESRLGGSQIDEATGLPYNNETSMDQEAPEAQVFTDHKPINEMDDAERWLMENDPNYDKTKKNWGN